MEQNPNLALSPTPPPAPTGTVTGDQAKMLQRLNAVLARFEITIAEANELVVLQDYEIVVIADDSGSMRSAAAPAHMRQIGQPSPTRWDELKHTVSEMAELASCFDSSGIDIFFLNRSPLLGVKGSADASFASAFAALPTGSTPLTETVQRVAERVAGERPVLLFVMTDGMPNGGKDPFIKVMRELTGPNSTAKVRVQIMACTSEESEISWLNELDAELTGVDVTDDYFSERQEVLNAGRVAKFTRGDWCMKAMLGPVSSKFDGWDERHAGGGGATPAGAGQDGCGGGCSCQ